MENKQTQESPHSALATYGLLLQQNCNNNNSNNSGGEDFSREAQALIQVLSLHLKEDTRLGLKYLIANKGYTSDLLCHHTKMSRRRCLYFTSILTEFGEVIKQNYIHDMRGCPIIYTLPDATREDVARILRSHKFSRDKHAPISMVAADNEAKYQRLVNDILVEVEASPWVFDKRTKTISRELFMAVRDKAGVHSWNSKRINQLLGEKGWGLEE